MNDFVFQVTDSIDHIIRSITLFKVEFALCIGFLLSIACTLIFDKYWKQSSFFITILTIISAFIILLTQHDYTNHGFYGMLTVDKTSFFARVFISLGLFVSTIFLQQHFANRDFKKRKGDLYSILLAAGIGLNLFSMTTHWLMAFIAIEMVSICSYILVGYFSENKKQAEAAMKYALFGSACSAVMLYGLSLIYGFTGDLNFASARHIQGLIAAPEVMVSIAILFVFTGIGFKLSFVPFHLWAPDVYEGAPTPVTAFLSTVPKIAAIILMARLATAWISTPFYFSELTFLFISIVSIVTMLAGNLIALRQTDIKRMMAYSSIGHTGFLMMAIIGYSNGQQDILFFYILVYTLMNLASFAFIDVLEQKLGSTQISSYTGLGKKLPLIFTCFSLVGISLIGLPPTAGFVGKLLVFSSIFEIYQSAGDQIFLWLLIVGALTSVISLFYYFKIPLYSFLKANKEDEAVISEDNKISIMLVIGVVLTVLVVLFGIFPTLIINHLF
ncbi:NADH-quinone oxidoreductase subunit N [Sphingobacterium sp. 1.A.5]|jgi:NADH-quinone oxidoreductase subunit N|uniref:NADH-quinone oxidoreductase subunit N n=1 Tax=Sphingobacterium sp. 1.A.5 TaxID=2044604 RepID=UPI000C0BEAD3|nr:NADH-quinone oxidoreductase subunit N [Sphingobacterium sp. 1.A.5]